MKIRQLHINRFGHFTECDLVFPGDGLQVVYGPNEAGKTTLLEFLRGLLFDFPARTPYDFGGQGEMAGVATLELRDGRTVELRRRKGNKDKVAIKLDGQPTELDDAGWSSLLDHADRGLFESVFAFGLDQLSLGEMSLKHESLQSALFGGSLGGSTSPDKIVADLSHQADELFKKGGSKPAINALLAELKRLTKDIKEHSLRPDKYRDAERDVTIATEHAQALHQQVDQLRREHAKIEKQVRAWPKWWDLQQRASERAGLSVLEQIPADARQRYQAVQQEIKLLAEGQAKHSEEIKRAKQNLASLKLDPGAISFRTEIKSCLELRQSSIESKEQLPERIRQREAIRVLIDRELAELRPGWSHNDLRAFSIDIFTRKDISRLSEERGDRATAHTKLSAKRDSDVENLQRSREDLAEIGLQQDITVLAAALIDEAEFVANQKQVENVRSELAKLDRKLTIQYRKLTPPLPTANSAPHELPVPRTETVTDIATSFAEIREHLRTVTASVEDDKAEQREIEKSLASAMSSHIVPSLDERDAARERRDDGWKLIHQKYISAEESESGIAAWLRVDATTSLADGYERAVRHADVIADQIYDNANEVAEREGLRRQLAALAMRLDQKEQRITEFEQQQTLLEKNWFALWEPCGFVPLVPDAMLGWLDDHETVCSTIFHRSELIEEISRVDHRIASFESRLRAACGLTDENVSVLLTMAKKSVVEAKEQQRRTNELQIEVRRLERQLTKYDDELQKLATSEAAANAAWQAILSRLNLPADWDPEMAREAIDKLSVTRVRLDSLPGEEARINAMQSRITEFDQRVQSLCEALESELLYDPPEVAIVKLDEQVERAIEAQRRHDDLSKMLTGTRRDLAALNDRHSNHDNERANLFALAEATNETEFLDVVSRAEKVVKLEGEIEQLKREIDLIRAGDDREDFESSLAQSERMILEGEQRDLTEQLRQQEKLKREADEEVGAARKELAQLDGSSTVAILTEDLSHKRSQLAAEVDRYMPLVFARHLLNAAVSRFEKDNQPEMIATVSRLLDQMTGGKYVEFDRTSGSNNNVFIRRSDGIERTPSQLSTGTREQLYLAIRLAYVLQYCDRNQPLPIIIDDVLVNFDEARTRQTLTALADISQTAQVLFFTCHPHMVSLACEVVPGLNPIKLPGVSGSEKRM